MTQFQHQLQVFITGSVVQGDKLVIAHRSDPTHDCDFLLSRSPPQGILNFNSFIEHSVDLGSLMNKEGKDNP
jgi:hypothetical protein